MVYTGGITCSGGSDPNYTRSDIATATLTVTQVPVTVTADSTSISSTTPTPGIRYTRQPTTGPSNWTTEPACAVYATTDTGYAVPLTGTAGTATYVTHCAGWGVHGPHADKSRRRHADGHPLARASGRPDTAPVGRRSPVRSARTPGQPNLRYAATQLPSMSSCAVMSGILPAHTRWLRALSRWSLGLA